MQRQTKTRYFAGLSRNTFLLAFASLFADISTEMLYPVLPIFLTQTLALLSECGSQRRSNHSTRKNHWHYGGEMHGSFL